MAEATFNAQSIFGQFTKITGPTRPYRAQESQLPGVNGVRMYALGKGVKTWNVSGRITGSGSAVESVIEAGLALQDGATHTFTDREGVSHANCMLNAYQPTNRTPLLIGGVYGKTVVVQATIVQISPEA